MSTAPRAVFAVPTFNGADHVAQALESLLGQTREDFAVVVVDDCSTDQTVAIAQRYASSDARVVVHRNRDRLGMVRNWRRAYGLARAMHPGADLFAWASDHDAWHPRWLETLAAELDEQPQAVLAWPLYESVDAEGHSLNIPAKRFDSGPVVSHEQRVARVVERMSAGNMVYGLMRADALARCGVYREVLLPDRLLIAQLSLLGELRQVPEVLWRRRFTGGSVSVARQRENFFPNRRTPAYMRLPWWLMHGAPFGLSLARGDLAPEVRPSSCLRLTRQYVVSSYRFQRRRENLRKAHESMLADRDRARKKRLRTKKRRRRQVQTRRTALKKARKMRKRATRAPALTLAKVSGWARAWWGVSN